MFRSLALTLSVFALLAADLQAQTTLSISDSVSVVGVANDPDNNGSPVLQTDANGNILNDDPIFVAPAGPGGVFDASLPTPGANFAIDYQYVIRERANTAQLNRTAYSFIAFDVSSLTLADVNDPNFLAEFTVDYVGALNTLNGPGQYALGTPTTAWDSTTTIPTTLTGEGATFVAGSTLIANSISPAPTPAGPITVDVTSLVRGWVDGSIPNNGVTFIETDGTVNIGDDVAGATTSQAGYFSNATIVTSTGGAVLLGDVNCDGIVNFLDIAPFIGVLSSGGMSDKADIDGSGEVNFLDIAPFIAILSGG